MAFFIACECMGQPKKQDLQRLAKLPFLSEISFSDPHFGTCPVVRAEGYLNFALCHLKKVTVVKALIGLSVTLLGGRFLVNSLAHPKILFVGCCVGWCIMIK